MEVNYARQIIKAASLNQSPRLNNILEEFDNFTKNLTSEDKNRVNTEEIMKMLVKVGRKAKNNDFLRYFDSIYGTGIAKHNETILHTNGSVSTKSGFTAQKSSIRGNKHSLRSDLNTFQKMK